MICVFSFLLLCNVEIFIEVESGRSTVVGIAFGDLKTVFCMLRAVEESANVNILSQSMALLTLNNIVKMPKQIINMTCWKVVAT